MFYDIQTTAYGKWILAGEHAVLRGHPALVYPMRDKKVILTYRATSHALQMTYAGTEGQAMVPVLQKTLEHALQILNIPFPSLLGHMHLHSDLPLGVGMGASAAVCVVIARFCVAQQWLIQEEIFSFAKQLEHLFHGRSSGLDLIGVSSEAGMYFQHGIAKPIEQTWLPSWSVSSCGSPGFTSACIEKVHDLWQIEPARADRIDQQMRQCVEWAIQALAQPDSIMQLADAMNRAADCFAQWELITPELEKHMQIMRERGALAVKPTGSGGGGCVVSLWPVV